MSAHTTQKYYLVNLSTRCISISTHLRGENYTLKSGKCIFLGNLTDELILKYSKYSALNVSLRIVTKDKLESILNKSVNLNNEQIKAILSESTIRQPHIAGSLDETVFSNMQNNTNSKRNVSEQKTVNNNGLFTQPLPTKNASVPSVKKQDIHDQNYVQNIENVENKKQETKVENKENFVILEKHEENSKENKNIVVEENIVEKEIEKPQEDIIPVVEESNDSSEENYDLDDAFVEQDENSIEEKKEEQLIGYYNEETSIPEYTVKEIDVVKENAKQNLSGMSYNELYELAKERNLLSGKRGRPSKDKLIEMISSDDVE